MKNVSRIAMTTSCVSVLSPFSQPDDVIGVALVYQKAFGSSPWNEGYICPVCGTTFADESGLWDYCTYCRDSAGYLVKILRCWPIHKILTDFYQEMLRPEAVCLIMKDRYGVIAFAWGYEVEVNKSLDKYLEAPKLHKLVKGNFLYLDECAVIPKQQNKGCGKKLMSSFIQKAQEINRNILLRTLKGEVMYRLVKNFGGKTIQNISKERVIMKIVV